MTPGDHTKHIHTPLNQTVLKHIAPIYKKLTEDSLLKRYSKGLTQNANESLHSRIWQRCPKTIFVSKERVEIAVIEAICEYNSRIANTMSAKYELLGLDVTPLMRDIAIRGDRKREIRSEIRRNKNTKRYREITKAAQAQREREMLVEEGTTYGAGKF